MTDYGPPFRIGGDKPGGVLKVKRGGTGGAGSSGNSKPRFYTPNACRRVSKAAKGSHHGGRVLPPDERGKAIWDPRDPFIIDFQKAHPRVEAGWRKSLSQRLDEAFA